MYWQRFFIGRSFSLKKKELRHILEVQETKSMIFIVRKQLRDIKNDMYSIIFYALLKNLWNKF